MGLPMLFGRPDNPEGWKAWAFNHAAIHYTVNDAVLRQKNQIVTTYQLSNMDPDNLAFWLYNHQAMHNETNAVLGLKGLDLLGLDWRDQDAFATWLQMHGDEHQQWNGALGV